MNLSAIIPFYIEGDQTGSIIEIISNLPQFNQIIAIDDGSTDGTSNSIRTIYPHITLVRLPSNQGKTEAVRQGLRQVTNEAILLADADYRNLQPSEIEIAINRFEGNSIDMLICKVRGGNNVFDRLMQKEILLSGLRILKKDDLAHILAQPCSRYLLEIAANRYMLDHRKKVCWMDCSAQNVHKTKKWGLYRGMKQSWDMEWSIVKRIGLLGYFRQFPIISDQLT